MSRRTVAMPSEDTLHTRVGGAQSRDEPFPRSSLSRPSTDMMLSSRPRTFDLDPEPSRAGLDGEQTHYVVGSYPSAAISRIAPQSFPSNTAVHLRPLATRNPPSETPGQETVQQYEITQNGLKFKGNVRGIKIIATQVASKTGLETAEHHLSVNGEMEHNHLQQSQVDSGFVNQQGARFLQSVTDTETEVSQSAGGKDFYIVTQAAVEVEGDVIGGSFHYNQRVW